MVPTQAMELREFAENILFATRLDEKLCDPGLITDEHPGPALATPESPGRPSDLQFKDQAQGKSRFPGVAHLENAAVRGRVLHFFANHELLATELMALVLLRFPDAPPAFRRGVLQTLRDEQHHTRLYVDRMRAFGISFGELPVSGFFWRAVSRMENPMDYVAGLSLTFEQANLDFAMQFGQAFQQVGDSETATLLDGIYHDEIAHVAYGLKWFRRWKNPDESDWSAYSRQLKFPLSPRRARGMLLNTAGRQAAGLDPEFIANLAVFSQSKGRTPNIHLFNPFTEGHIAHGRSFSPGKHPSSLAVDLANLPQFLCDEDDVVLVTRRPAVAFLSGLKQAGFLIPEFVELDASQKNPEAPPAHHAQRKVGILRPWAWGPDSMEILRPHFVHVTGESRRPEERFHPGLAALYSKTWSAQVLREFIAQRRLSHGPEDWLCPESVVGVAAASPDAARALIDSIRDRGHARVVVKEALGLAGSNALRLWEPTLSQAQLRWITTSLQNGREAVVEPWLERVIDFSAQLEMGPKHLELRGFTTLINDARGQYEGNAAAPDHRQRLPTRVTRLLSDSPDAPRDLPTRVHSLFHDLFQFLQPRLADAGFLGPLGIDAFVYRAEDGRCRLKPVVEINPRHTMGRLTVELMRHTCPGTHGLFRLVNRSALRREGFIDFPALARSLAEHHPLQRAGEPVARIREGAVCLTDPDSAQVCLAVFHASRQPLPSP